MYLSIVHPHTYSSTYQTSATHLVMYPSAYPSLTHPSVHLPTICPSIHPPFPGWMRLAWNCSSQLKKHRQALSWFLGLRLLALCAMGRKTCLPFLVPVPQTQNHGCLMTRSLGYQQARTPQESRWSESGTFHFPLQEELI